jgi:hypothetical protein
VTDAGGAQLLGGGLAIGFVLGFVSGMRLAARGFVALLKDSRPTPGKGSR